MVNDRNKTLHTVSSDLTKRLTPKFGPDESRALVHEIFMRIKNWTNVDLAIRDNEDLSDFIIKEATDVTQHLLNDEPIQYIFSRAHFYGMDFIVTPATLIPRPETASMVDMIVKENASSDLRILDLGTGCGCIAVALARNLRFPKVTAVDISHTALDVARENAARLKAKIDFIEADMLLLSTDNKYDIIVSNPPYIADSERSAMDANVLDHEPHLALFVPDSDPLRFYKAVVRIAHESLNSDGKIYLEINPLFADDLRHMFRDNGFQSIDILKDMDGRDRFAIIRNEAT